MAVDFAPTEEQAPIVETVRRFPKREAHPLEPEVLRRGREGSPGLEEETLPDLRGKARRSDLGGLDTPEEYGGAGLDAVTRSLVHTEVGRTYAPFTLGGEADDILYRATPAQQEEYLFPTLEGTRRSCFAVTEPDHGVRDGGATAFSSTAPTGGPLRPSTRWAGHDPPHSSSTVYGLRELVCRAKWAGASVWRWSGSTGAGSSLPRMSRGSLTVRWRWASTGHSG